MADGKLKAETAALLELLSGSQQSPAPTGNTLLDLLAKGEKPRGEALQQLYDREGVSKIPPAPKRTMLQQWSPHFREWQAVARAPQQEWNDVHEMWVNRADPSEEVRQFTPPVDVPPEQVAALNRMYLSRR